MKTLEEYQEEEARKSPHLSKRFTDDCGYNRWLADWYAARVDELVELSDDPGRAKELYEQHAARQSTMRAKLARFKALLVAAHLIERALIETIPNEPPKGSDTYEKQALFLE